MHSTTIVVQSWPTHPFPSGPVCRLGLSVRARREETVLPWGL